MSEKTKLEQYIEYTEILKKKLDVYFNEQKEFLACKQGCDLCCKNSYYPCSELEYEYIRIGLNTLYNEEEKQKVYDTAINILKDRREFLKTNSDIMQYVYECPFLVNGACGVYQYRALICSIHGLIYKDVATNKNNAPFCMKLGLNYAEVYDEKTGKFSEEKVRTSKFKTLPKVYNLSYSEVMKSSKISDYGDIRMIFEWIIMDIPDYEERIK